MIKILRIVVVAVFLVVFSAFSYFYIKNYIETDNTIPVITLNQDIIRVKVNAKPEDLLKGVSAYDEKDGDLTDEVIVESVSRFIDKGICKVTYAVCDSDNHVTTATRKVEYTDYESPAFSLSRSLCFSTYEAVDIKNSVDVNDCFDGSLKNHLLISSNDFSSATAGVFSIDFSVTNSKGDAVKLTLPLIVEDRSLSAPKIELNSYLMYSPVGAEIDVDENILSAADSAKNDLTQDVIVDTNLDVNVPGTYIVHYYVSDIKGNRGHSTMYVIVESEDDDK